MDNSSDSQSDEIEDLDITSNYLLINQDQIFDADKSALQPVKGEFDEYIFDHENDNLDQRYYESENDLSLLNEINQSDATQNTRNPDELDEETRRRINLDLHQCIKKFTQELINKTARKTQELMKLIKLLQEFRISQDILVLEVEQSLQEENAQTNYFVNRQKPIKRQTQRINYKENLQNHLRQGTQIKFFVCDSGINPFFFSFNQTLLFLQNSDSRLDSPTLDLLDQFLRIQKPTIYIVSDQLGGRINSLGVQFSDGLLQFQIKSGMQESGADRLFYDVLQLCCSLSDVFRNICAFLGYWADRRGILSEQILPEFALYCMVIDFFQLNDLLPRFFDMKYCSWSEEKKLLMKKHLEIPKVNEYLLDKQFDRDEYVIVNKKGLRRKERDTDIFKKVHFHTFPRARDYDFVRKVWQKQKKSQIKNADPLNLGALIAKFFHYYSMGKVQRRRIDIAQAEKNPNAFEIGYMVMSPIVPGECYSKYLRARMRNGELVLPKAYMSVKGEFERAYDLLINCKFQEICEKRKTFVSQ